MPLVGLWHGGLRDQSVEDMANANLPVMRFLGLDLEDDEPDHSVLLLQDRPDDGPGPGWLAGTDQPADSGIQCDGYQ